MPARSAAVLEPLSTRQQPDRRAGVAARLACVVVPLLLLSVAAAWPTLRRPALAVCGDDLVALGRALFQDHAFPDSYVGPVYVAVAGFFSTLDEGPPRTLLLFQIALSASTVWLAFELSRALFDDVRSAVVGAGLFAVSPLRLIYQACFLTETLYLFLLYSGLLLFTRAVKGTGSVLTPAMTTVARSSASGLLIGTASLTRGNALVVGVGLSCMLVVFALPRRRVVTAAAFLAGFAAVVGAWSVRNAASCCWRTWSRRERGATPDSRFRWIP